MSRHVLSSRVRLGLFGMLLTACQPAIAPRLKVSENLRPADYIRVLNLWTSADDLYTGFEHRMTVKATFITPMLRKAFQLRFPEIYGHGGVITRREMVDFSGEAEETLNFFIGVYTANDKWNDLNRPDSIWHVTLSSGARGTRAEATVDAKSIEKIRVDENIRTVYPDLDVFDSVYVVRFPTAAGDNQPLIATDQPTKLEMRIASSFGSCNLGWSVLP